mmetsp:Transcript_22772/g.56214  ORF Transcript_22772/g.56214 Transcript_22772/m.56214 type:complete len:105 (-) Transcript_22772:133-447(-)
MSIPSTPLPFAHSSNASIHRLSAISVLSMQPALSLIHTSLQPTIYTHNHTHPSIHPAIHPSNQKRTQTKTQTDRQPGTWTSRQAGRQAGKATAVRQREKDKPRA